MGSLVRKDGIFKKLFADLIGAKKDEIAIDYSVSSALSALLSGFGYKERNKLVVGDMEYPTTNFIFLAQELIGAKTIKSRNYKIS